MVAIQMDTKPFFTPAKMTSNRFFAQNQLSMMRLTNTLRAGYVLKRIAYGTCSCGYH